MDLISAHMYYKYMVFSFRFYLFWSLEDNHNNPKLWPFTSSLSKQQKKNMNKHYKIHPFKKKNKKKQLNS